MVRTIDVKRNTAKDVLFDSLADTKEYYAPSVYITSSGLLKIMHERDGKLHDVIFLKERERKQVWLKKDDRLIFHNQSMQTSLSVYLITLE